MPIYVNKNNSFEQAEPLSRECPHCGAHAQMLPLATPSYATLVQTRPRHVGIVFRCAACSEPRFVRVAVRAFEAERVLLAANLVEIERSRERFQFGYLPANLERLLQETLDCYTAGAYNAFASMCRRTVHAALAPHDLKTRRRWQELVHDVLAIGEIDGATGRAVESVLFAEQGEPPEIGADEAAVLIEAVKDLFYQAYVRTAKLKAAINMRRYFAFEGGRKVTPIDRGRRELA